MICLRLLLHTVFFAEYFACDNAGNSSAARMAMMAMTTNSSIKVKAFAQRAFFFWELDFTEYREPYSQAVISSTPVFAGPPAAARSVSRSQPFAPATFLRWPGTPPSWQTDRGS